MSLLPRIPAIATALCCLALAACSSDAAPADAESASGSAKEQQNVVVSSQSPQPEESASPSGNTADGEDVPTVPGYAPGAFPEVPLIAIPDVSLLTDSAPAFSVSLEERFADLKGVKVTAAQCTADGKLSTNSVNSSMYTHKDGALTVTNDGSGAGRYKNGALEIVNNGDGSGSLKDGALSITVSGDGSGQYVDGALNVTVDGSGAGRYKNGALEIVNNGDGSGRLKDGALEIVNNGDGSGSYKNGAFSITNDGKGKAFGKDGLTTFEVEAEPLSKLAPVGSFPSLDALTPDNVCGVLVTVESEVLFDFGSYEVRPEAKTTLRDVASALNDVEAPAAEVIGHTDSIDDEAFNQKLSQDRAAAVVDELKSQGVTATLTATGKGELEPVAPNANEDGSDNPAGRQLNRRVEIFIPAF